MKRNGSRRVLVNLRLNREENESEDYQRMVTELLSEEFHSTERGDSRT